MDFIKLLRSDTRSLVVTKVSLERAVIDSLTFGIYILKQLEFKRLLWFAHDKDTVKISIIAQKTYRTTCSTYPKCLHGIPILICMVFDIATHFVELHPHWLLLV